MRVEARAAPSTAIVALLVLASAGGCEAPPASTDASVAPTGLPSCDEPQIVTPTEGLTTSVVFDTRTARDGELALGTCGGGTTAPQAVVAIQVPGTGPHTVSVSSVNVGTDTLFDTVLLMRRGTCDATPEDGAEACFDDDLPERRASGSLRAQGGETVYAIITGYEGVETHVDRGPVQLDIVARPNAAPTIEGAAVLVTDGAVVVDVTGGDADADVASVQITFHGPAGELVDLDGDGERTAADVLSGGFDRPVSGALRFTERATLAVSSSAALASASEAWVRLVDASGTPSEADTVTPVLVGAIVGNGEACDATHVCGAELTCPGGMCVPSAERVGVCSAAAPIELQRPTATTTSTSVMGVLMTGTGLFGGPCGATIGREDVYRAVIPEGRFDLVATTDVDGTGVAVDTVLYVRRVCTDPATTPPEEGVGCSDDLEAGSLRSRLEWRDVPPGELFFFVEDWGGVPVDEMTSRYELRVSLRPVIASGEACDPDEVIDRCEGEPCPVAARRCP